MDQFKNTCSECGYEEKAGHAKTCSQNISNEEKQIDYSKVLDELLFELPSQRLHKIIALKLIKMGKAREVADCVNQLSYPDKEVALALIQHDQAASVAENLERFVGLDKEVAKKLIEVGESYFVAKNINVFEDLDEEIAMELIKNNAEWDEEYQIPGFASLYTSEGALKLIENGQSWFLTNRIAYFRHLNQEVTLKLIEIGKAQLVAANLIQFDRMTSDIALKLIDAGYEEEVIEQIHHFDDLSKNVFLALIDYNATAAAGILKRFSDLDEEVTNKLIDGGQIKTVARFLNSFSDLTKKTAAKLIKENYGRQVVNSIDVFQSSDHRVIASYLIGAGYGEFLVINMSRFVGLDHNQVVKELFEQNQEGLFLKFIEKFKELGLDAAIHLIAIQQDESVIKNIASFKSELQSEIAKELIDQNRDRSAVAINNIFFFAEHIANFTEIKKEKEVGKFLITQLILNRDLQLASSVNKHFNNQDRDLDRTLDIFGNFATRELYEIIVNLMAGTLSVTQESLIRELGITNMGIDGLQEMRKIITDFGKTLVSKEGPDTKLLQSSIIVQCFKFMIRYGVSAWGDNSEGGFVEMLQEYETASATSKPLADEYTPSEILNVDKIDKDKQGDFIISKQAKSRFSTLVTGLSEGLEAYDSDGALTKALENIKQICREQIENRRSKINTAPNEYARKNILNIITQLENINLDNISENNWQDIFSDLASFGGLFEKELLASTFFWAFHLKPASANTARELINSNKNPTISDISKMLDLVDHMVNKETLANFFTNKKAADLFRKLVGVKALTEELSRAQNQETKGTTTMQFIPQRNLMTEFSGHIADACWASKYPSIIKSFPNFISLLMVTNPDKDKDMRVAGSAFLIETTSEDGKPLLVIRGLNPQENIINQLSEKDFYDKVTTYVKELAQKTGRTACIVIDDHSGGSSTNRPVLFQYLSDKKKTLEKIPTSNEDSIFNGYNISDDVYKI